MTKSSEMEAKVAILDKCCQSVECLARGKVFDLVGTLDLPQSSSPETETPTTCVTCNGGGIVWRNNCGLLCADCNGKGACHLTHSPAKEIQNMVSLIEPHADELNDRDVNKVFDGARRLWSAGYRRLDLSFGHAQQAKEPLAIENEQLRRTIQLHAGDAQSLSGEVEMWRERALEAEAALSNTSTVGNSK